MLFVDGSSVHNNFTKPNSVFFQVGSNRQQLDCIAALTDIALEILQDEDCVPSKHQKPG